MIFKTIQKSGDSFIVNLKNTLLSGFNGIFSTIKSQKFSFDSGFSKTLNADILALKKFRRAISNGVDPNKATQQYLSKASQSAKDYSEQIKNGTGSAKQFGKQQRSLQVSTQALDKSFKNCKAMITEYNSATENSNKKTTNAKLNQKQFANSVSQSNSSLGAYLTSLNGAKGSLGGYIKYLVSTKAATIALNAATMALNMAFVSLIAMGLSRGIQWVIDNTIKAKEIAAEEAKEASEESKQALQDNQERIDSIDELIQKYKELKEEYNKSNDEGTRTEILDVQSQIVDLVGNQIGGLDLVNGELNEQLGLLQEIGKQQVANNAETAQAALNNALKAADTTTGSNKEFLDTVESKHGLSKEITNTFSEEMQEVFDDALGMGSTIRSQIDLDDSALRNSFKSNLDIEISTALGKITALEMLIDELNKTTEGRTSDVYSDLVSELERYKGLRDDVVYALNSYMDSKITEVELTDEFKNKEISDATSFNEYWGALSHALSNDKQIQDAIANGYITLDDVWQYVADDLSTRTELSEYYNAWLEQYGNGLDETTEEVFELTNGKKREISEKFKQSSGISEDTEVDLGNIKFNIGLIEPDESKYSNAQKDAYNELTSWFNMLSKEDQALVYNISIRTDDTQLWSLTQWKNELETLRNTSITSAESMEIFNEVMGASADEDGSFTDKISKYTEDIESLNNALFALNTGKELTKSEKLELLEKFPSLSGSINDTNSLKTAISALIKTTNEGIDKDFQEQIEAVGGASTQAGKNLEEYRNLLLSDDGSLSFSFDFNLEDEITKLSNFYSAVGESISGKGLSTEAIDNIKNMFADLPKGNTDKLFEHTANGIHLNVTELRNLKKEYENVKKQNFKTELQELKSEYNELSESIELLNEAGYANTNAYNKKIAERDAIAEEINYVQTLATQYDGLTSAYNKWVEAKSAGSERDMYESILSEREAIQSLIDRGWVGSEEVRTYVDLLSYKDLSTATVDEILAEWDRLQQTIVGSNFSVMDFFTVDEDGNTVTQGIYNFFETVHSVLGSEFARLENGKWVYDFSSTGDKYVADTLGMDLELMQTILRSTTDAGFVTNLGSIENLKTRVEETEQAVKNLNAEPIDIDVNAEDVDAEIKHAQELINEVKNSDIDPNVKSAQLDDANAKLDVLIEKKQELSNPTFMDVEVNGVEEDLQEPLTLLQDYQNAVNKLNELEIKGADLKEIAKAQKEIEAYVKQIYELDTEVKAEIGIEADDSIEEIKEKIANDKITIKTDLDIENDISIKEAISKLEGILFTLATRLANKITTSFDESLSNIFSDKDIDINANVTGKELIDNLYNAIYLLQDKTVAVNADVQGQIATDNLFQAIDRLEDKIVDVRADVDGIQEVDNLYYAIRDLTDKTVYVTTVLEKISKTKPAEVDGTAHVDGTAFARGSWGTKDSGVALAGEEDFEIVVRDGKFFTIGEKSAELFNYRKGDIIFNAQQSKQILEKGKITHGRKRGKAFVTGNAFSDGTGGIYYTPKPNTETNNGGNDSSPESTANDIEDSVKDTEKSIDRVAIKLDRIRRAVEALDSAVNNTYSSWADRNNNVSAEIAKVTEEIDLQTRASERYLKEANKQINKYGLDLDWVEDIQNGGIAFSYLVNLDELYEGYQTYQNWYEKMLDCKEAAEELKQTLSELYKTAFDNIVAEYDDILSSIENKSNIINEKLNQTETKGYLATANYYKVLQQYELANIEKLQQEKEALLLSLDQALKSGTIEQGSQSWNEMVGEIDDVTLSIEEAKTAVLEYNNSIRDVEWSIFDKIQDEFKGVTDEVNFLINLLSSKDLYQDNGQLTSEGNAVMGLHAVDYNVYMAQADKYAEEIKKLNAEIANDPYNQDLINRRNELLQLQRDSIEAAQSEKNAIVDVVKEGIELELSSLKELIETYEKALDGQKD